MTTASVQASASTSYIANNGAAGVAVSLPATPALGDRIQVNGLAPWMVVPNMNQSIIQDMAGTGAVTGGALSGGLGGSLVLDYVGNNSYMVTAYVGKITSDSNNIYAHNGLLWVPPIFDLSHLYTWQEGTDHCASLSISSLTGWRLPTSAELVALDKSGVAGQHGWPSVPGNIWTSDVDPNYAASYGVVAFGYGVAAYQPAGNNLSVTCVH